MKKPKYRLGKPHHEQSGAANDSSHDESGWFTRWGKWLVCLLVLGVGAVFFYNNPFNNATEGDPNDGGVTSKQSKGKSIWSWRTKRVPTAVGHPELKGPTGDLFRKVIDASAPMKSRRESARRLALLESDAALTAVRRVIAIAPSNIKAAIGEGLGESRHPESTVLLHQLVDGTDEIAARGAIRGLASRNDAAAVTTLADILNDERKPESVRTEAALNLGEIDLPSSSTTLIDALAMSTDASLTEHILMGLGKRPFEETKGFYRDFIAAEGNSAESKVAALESLGNNKGTVGEFLLQQCGNPDARLREAAAQSLGQVDEPGEFAPEMIKNLQKETEAGVRTKMYEALANQSEFDVKPVVELARGETNFQAQMGALHLMATLSSQNKSPEAKDYFEQKGVPTLKQQALKGTDAYWRLDSVITLRRANNPAAQAALEEISKVATDKKVLEAAQSALKSRKARLPR